MTSLSQAIAERNTRPVAAEPATELTIRPGQDFWTAKQQAALQVLGIKNATNADLAVFLHYCQKTGLDPFSRQIYMICRREKQGDTWVDKQTIQVGIGGLQVIRDRVARRDHLTVEYEDTQWFDDGGISYEVWLRDEPPAACRIAVIKNGQRFPAVVRWKAYMQTGRDGKPNSMWARMDAEQLEKCAEAKALRRAFPHDLGGLYIEEELPADAPKTSRRGRRAIADRAAPAGPETFEDASPIQDVPLPQEDAETGELAGKHQLNTLRAIFGTIGWNDPEHRDARLAVCAIKGTAEGQPPLDLATSTKLTKAQAERVIAWLRGAQEREGDNFAQALTDLIADPADTP